MKDRVERELERLVGKTVVVQQHAVVISWFFKERYRSGQWALRGTLQKSDKGYLVETIAAGGWVVFDALSAYSIDYSREGSDVPVVTLGPEPEEQGNGN